MTTKATKSFFYRTICLLFVAVLVLTVAHGCKQTHFATNYIEAWTSTETRVQASTPLPVTATPKITDEPSRTLTSTHTVTQTPTETKTVTPSAIPTITLIPTSVGLHMEFNIAEPANTNKECVNGVLGILSVSYDEGLGFVFDMDVPDLLIRTESTSYTTKMTFEFDPIISKERQVVEISKGLLLMITFSGLKSSIITLPSGKNSIYVIPSEPGMLCGDEGNGMWLRKYGMIPFMLWITVDLNTGKVSRYVGDRYFGVPPEELCALVKKMPEVAIRYGFKDRIVYDLRESCPYIVFK